MTANTNANGFGIIAGAFQSETIEENTSINFTQFYAL